MVMFEQKIATSGEKTLGVCVLYVCYRKPTVVHVIWIWIRIALKNFVSSIYKFNKILIQMTYKVILTYIKNRQLLNLSF